MADPRFELELAGLQADAVNPSKQPLRVMRLEVANWDCDSRGMVFQFVCRWDSGNELGVAGLRAGFDLTLVETRHLIAFLQFAIAQTDDP